MSSIIFDATLNKEKLDAAIRESNQTIKQWSEGVERAGGQADQSFSKLDKSLKDSIRNQKEYIKGLTKEIKDMQKAFDDATAGKGKKEIGNELIQAKRRLSEATGELIGMQNEQIAINQKEAESQNVIINKLKGWALGLVTVGAALKIAKGIIDSTEESARKFKQIIAGATAGVGYFFKSIASGDWSNFFGNMDKAIRGAAEFVKKMDELANKQNEQKIKSAEFDKEIAELRDLTYDKDEANNIARQDALTKILAKQEKKYTAEAKLLKENYKLNLERTATASGLSEEQIENFIKEYSSLEKLIEVGEEYNELTKLMYSPGMTSQYLSSLEKQRDALGDNADEAGKYVKQISKVTPEVRKQLANFAASAIEAEAAFQSKNRRDKMQLAQVTNAIKDEEEAKKKKAQEDAKIENQIIAQKKLLDKAVETGNKAEMEAIAARIVKLQDELYIRQKIAETAIGAAIVREAPLTKITGLEYPTLLPGGFKAPEKLAEIGKEPPGDYIPGTWILSEAGEAKRAQRQKEDAKEAEETLKRQIELRKQIVNAAADLVYQLGQAVGLGEEEQEQLGMMLDSFTRLVSGDIVGAVMSMVSSVIMSFPSAAERYANEIERLNELLAEQQRLIELSERKGGKREVLAGAADIAQQILEENEAALARAEDKLRRSRGGIFFGKRMKDVEELTQAVKDSKIAVEDAQQVLDDYLRGGITENTIADVIAQGFREGKTSVDDFADYMNKVLIDAVMSVFTDTLLSSPKMLDYMEWLKGAMTGGITDAEKEENARRIAAIATENKATYEAMINGLDMGGDIAADRGLSMGIQRQITESTASELTGLWRRSSDDIRQMKDYTLLGINNLSRIETNTFQTVVRLDSAIIELQNIVKNTKQPAVGTL